ncbi:MAG TPA: IclR family transcriptional regulator [Frankiaceae bacterium]|nr:IclR family transcriptional regulator [Frankiaceae bacterium]
MKASVADSAPLSSMVQRMTAILDTFDGPVQRRSLQEVVDATGLPSSSAHRILDQLLELGWVEHDASGYCLGWRVRQLGNQVDRAAALREAAAPFIQELALRTPFVVHLAVLDGPFVRYLDKVGGQEALRVPSRVGGLLPAHLTAVGKAMLAYTGTDALDATLEQAASRGDAAQVDVVAVHRELAAIRTRGGLSSERNSPLAAVACVGAPIFDGGHVIGALSLCDGGNGKALGPYTSLLRERAQRISVQLASSPEPLERLPCS